MAQSRTMYVGMDVHKDSMAVAGYPLKAGHYVLPQ